MNPLWSAWTRLFRQPRHDRRRVEKRCAAKNKRSHPRPDVEPLEDRNLLAVYAITDLGILGKLATSFAYGVNASGQVAGYSGGGQRMATLYSNGTLTGLGTLGGFSSAAYGINDSGQVVGAADTSGSSLHAFLYSGVP